MIRKLLCALGRHQWRQAPYGERIRRNLCYTPFYIWQCPCCGKEEVTSEVKE
jgi:hypothetical protein